MARTHIGTTLISPLDGTLAAGGNKITGLANGTAATDAAAFGQIKYIQMVFGTTIVRTTTTSTTFVDTNLTATINITSALSRIKVSVSGTLDIVGTGTFQAIATVKRTSTNIGNGIQGISFYFPASSTAETEVPCSFVVVDSPATTGNVTYTVQIASSSASGTAKWIGDNSLSTIILEEIL